MSRPPSTRERGNRQEARAAALLRAAGLHIVEQNFACPLGEIDLIARDGNELVFVEVRSRRAVDHGRAEDTIDHHKRCRIIRVAEVYLTRRRPRFATCRFDVVAINGDHIQHFIDAFRIEP